MAETVQFTIGAKASCSDGTCGEVTRVIVNPVAEAVTRLVVEPEHRQGLGKLVPLLLIDATAGQVRLRCTKAEFEKLDPAEESRFPTGTSGYAGYLVGTVCGPLTKMTVLSSSLTSASVGSDRNGTSAQSSLPSLAPRLTVTTCAAMLRRVS